MDHAVGQSHALIEKAHHDRGCVWWMLAKGIQTRHQRALTFLATNIRHQLSAALKRVSCSLGELQQVHGTTSHMFFRLSYN